MSLAVVVFTLATLAAVFFQLALVLGAPWGELTQGGRHRGRLPARARWIAALSVLVLLALLAIVLARAGVGPVGLVPLPRALAWVVVGLLALSCLANAATPSRRERVLWLPLSLGMLVSAIAVALS